MLQLTRKMLRLIVLVLICFNSMLYAQDNTGSLMVEGIVRDEFGNPVNNAIVRSEIGKNEDFTHMDGKFSLQIKDGSRSIILSCYGYTTQQISIEKNTPLDVRLKRDYLHKDAVVHNWYIREVKSKSASAISTITGEELEHIPGAFLTSRLTGNLTGLTTTEYSGILTQPTISRNVRGISSVNTTEPYVIVDGLPSDNSAFENILPSEIESISLLKDAAALSLYGLQGSNGALVITTKRGHSGKLKFGVNVEQTFQQMTRKPYKINSWDYAGLKNTAALNDGLSPQFTAAEIQKYRDQNDELYPNNDYYNAYWKEWSARQNISVNATGGNDLAKYFTSINFTHIGVPFVTDRSNEKYDPSSSYWRMGFRGNLDMNLTKNFSAFLLISGNIIKENYPGSVNSPNSLYPALFNFAPSMYGPLVPQEKEKFDLSAGQVLTNSKGSSSAYALINRSGYAYYLTTHVNTQVGLKYDLNRVTKGLNITGNVGYGLYSYIGQVATQSYEQYQQPNREELKFIRYGSSVNGPLTIAPAPAQGSYTMDYRINLNYQRDFGKHAIASTAYFNYATKILPTWQSSSPASMFPYLHQSNGLHISYGFDNKYIIQLNAGYTGSDAFASDRRYSFTPSVAAAWVASNEMFLAKNTWLTYLKLRASAGYTANDRFNGNRLAYMDNLSLQGQELGVGNPYLVAEKTFMQNYGFDLELFKRVTVSLDVFSNNTDNMILTDNRIPVFAGVYNYQLANAALLNMGEMTNKGFDLGVDYNKQFNRDFSVSAGVKYSYAKNKILTTNEIRKPVPEFASAYYYTGNPVGQIIGYQVDYDYKNADGVANGFINDAATLAKYKNMYETGGIGTPRLGDLIYKDLNNDGKIDERDYAPIKGSTVPAAVFSFVGGVRFKLMELNFMFQGIGNKYVDLGNATGINETYHEGIFSDAHLESWTPERYANREPISFPALGDKISTSHQPNDFFVQNTSFIRLRNIELAYTLPQSISGKITAQKIRIALSAQNLFTWTTLKMTRHFDPETPDLTLLQPFRAVNLAIRCVF